MVIVSYVTNKEIFHELDKTKLRPVYLNKLNMKDFVSCLQKICPRTRMTTINITVLVIYLRQGNDWSLYPTLAKLQLKYCVQVWGPNKIKVWSFWEGSMEGYEGHLMGGTPLL